MLLTPERLREVLAYDRKTGVFTWRVRLSRRNHIGDIAGCRHHGYVIIRIDGRNYQAHRLAFMYVSGRWPDPETDHRDGDRTNNRFKNLRELTGAQNKQNLRRAHRDSRHGFLGVTQYHEGGSFVARIQLDGRRLNLGSFATPEKAHAAYVRAKRQLHSSNTL